MSVPTPSSMTSFPTAFFSLSIKWLEGLLDDAKQKENNVVVSILQRMEA